MNNYGLEDINLRFYLVDKLFNLKYGESYILDQELAYKAWPPTGYYDSSPYAFLRAVAIMNRGGTPEEDLTTEDRIKRDLDESFYFERRQTGDYYFHRKDDACPDCRGKRTRTVVEYFLDIDKLSDPSSAFPSDEHLTRKVINCPNHA